MRVKIEYVEPAVLQPICFEWSQDLNEIKTIREIVFEMMYIINIIYILINAPKIDYCCTSFFAISRSGALITRPWGGVMVSRTLLLLKWPETIVKQIYNYFIAISKFDSTRQDKHVQKHCVPTETLRTNSLL